jgi:Pentacotripeptide-repeat region of PRORP
MEQSKTPPTVFIFNQILSHWALKGTPQSAERADKILAQMKVLEKSKPELRPNLNTYNTILTAWSLAGAHDAGDRMWHVYEKMLADGEQPDIVTYTGMINFYSASRRLDYIQRADNLLKLMEKSNLINPDVRHYMAVLRAWIYTGNVGAGTQVFIRQVEGYINDKNIGAKPSKGGIRVVAKALISSKKLMNAMSFLEKMQDLHDSNYVPDGPDAQTYNMLLDAWKQLPTSVKRDSIIAKLEMHIAAAGKSLNSTSK